MCIPLAGGRGKYYFSSKVKKRELRSDVRMKFVEAVYGGVFLGKIRKDHKRNETDSSCLFFQLVPEASVVSGSEDSTPSPISGTFNMMMMMMMTMMMMMMIMILLMMMVMMMMMMMILLMTMIM